MGFPSPATDYVEQKLSVNSICNVGRFRKGWRLRCA
nr:MAG TPA_asm: B3 domain-containing transcription repressor [Caudoviricetes sp.]